MLDGIQEKSLVKNRSHQGCGGRVFAMTDTSIPLGQFLDGDPIVCEKCQLEGEILVDDGGVDFNWFESPVPARSRL